MSHPIRQLGMALLLSALAVCLSGCNFLTGPNRILRLLGPEATGDFATFEGSLTQRCIDTYAMINEPGLGSGQEHTTVGCIIEVTPVGGVGRRVFCPLGPMRDKCRLIPMAARVSFNGKPIGDNQVYLPTSLSWAGE